MFPSVFGEDAHDPINWRDCRVAKFLDNLSRNFRKVGEFVGAAGSDAGGVRKRIRGSKVAACHRLLHGVRFLVALQVCFAYPD